ncbi:MAG TPA: glycosyltransferase family 2 protein [Acidimicrobiales bacterium]|nr:glycosyltransferase family 2 protein [Acidimicrobiales bacterium]
MRVRGPGSLSSTPPGELAARVGAVIVNYNAKDHLLECVASLEAAGVTSIVVADNASTDGSEVPLAEKHPDTVFLQTGANLGYGGAANRGARSTDREFLLVCNPDTLFDAKAPAHLVQALLDDEAAGAAGPRVDTPSGDVYPSARTFPSVTDSIGHGFLGLIWRNNPWSRRYLMSDRALDRAQTVDWISGSCMMLRRSAFDEIRGFDESFFMYAEDVDLCRRLRDAGWSTLYMPGARVVHVQGVSSARHPYRMIVAHHRSLFRFATLTAGGGRDRLLLPVVALGLGTRAALLAAGRAISGRRGK